MKDAEAKNQTIAADFEKQKLQYEANAKKQKEQMEELKNSLADQTQLKSAFI